MFTTAEMVRHHRAAQHKELLLQRGCIARRYGAATTSVSSPVHVTVGFSLIATTVTGMVAVTGSFTLSYTETVTEVVPTFFALMVNFPAATLAVATVLSVGRCLEIEALSLDVREMRTEVNWV